MPTPWEVPHTHEPRNTHIFSGDGSYLGGIWLNSPPNISNAEFHNMCEQFIIFPTSRYRWHLHRLGPDNDVQELVPRDLAHIRQGYYVIMGNISQTISVTLTTEQVVRRLPTRQMRRNQRHFRRTLFQRDGSKCAITGRQAPGANPRLALAAAHVFPLAQHQTWVNNNYERWITDRSAADDIGPDKMFSAQNGLTLIADVHILFASFVFAINPDQGYRVIVFGEDRSGDGGGVLDRSARMGDPNHCISDDCLRWHYRQAVIKHMRGVAEPPWDIYYDDLDDMDMIMEREDAAEVLEIELGNRLGAYIEVS
ncbi:HNH endonuclease signature motif containing protein [Aspergillus puulaauensis]|uniref:HNH nuclease domain-containing protein n=1 Tax=Aspergillus puulaauensis TaxID=1220207 RepID=A0A7R7XCB1_9EURO|nr:uncharacterized protein APUU_11266S [Aspergillus puulaauensis]BCS18438.1 hypothetical protein APUU_11266S [Aspergillus puulaauensis]